MGNNIGRRRVSKNTITTRSGKTIKLNRSINDRRKESKASRDARHAAYLATLPKERWKRWLYRLKPKHLVEYWFSREGAISALKIIGASIVVLFFVAIGMFAYFRKDLPQIKDLSGDAIGGTVSYYDRTGQTLLFNDYNSVKRVPVAGNNISIYMKQATVAVEDKNFYKEGAFDVRSIIRAGVHDVSGGGQSLQGGSTITQQLVKLDEGWTDDQTITRKVKELILAVELERQYSKNDILTGYLNIAPYGGLDYGVESAANDYFQTSAKNLTLAQATMLAAIPKAPSYYSPYAGHTYNPAVTVDTFSPNAMIERQHYILDQMVKQHYISVSQANVAKAENVLAEIHQQQSKYQNIIAPYFVQAVKQQLVEKYGASTVARGGWKVTTTMDINLENKATQLVAENLSNLKRRTAGLADEEATILENVPTGQIEALVGGVNFNDKDHGEINYAASVLIPPGSSFKPYDYTTLIDNNNNVGAGSVLYDSEGPLPGYPCTNHAKPKNGGNCLADYDFLQPGPLTLRYALGGSRNIPAVKAMLEAVPNDKSSGHTSSVNKVISTASAMMANPYIQSHKQQAYNCYQSGVDISNATSKDITQCYGAAAIGDGAFLHLEDHVNGLSTLGRLGNAIPETYILKITDAGGKSVYKWKQPKGKQVIKQDSAYIVNNMASDPKASYLPGSCSATTCTSLGSGGYKFQRDNGWTFAVKTGTTDNGFDGLMTSWSPEFATVSWVGNHTRNVDISSRTGTAMEYLTEPITRGMMEASHTNLKPVAWNPPKDVKTQPAFIVRNHIHYGDIEPSPSTDLFPSWYIGGSTNKVTSSVIDKVSLAAATSCTPPLARDNVFNGNAASWNIDIFKGGKQSLNVGSTSGTASTAVDNVHNCSDSPPSITLTAPTTCNNSCTITATVTQGTHLLTDPKYPNFPGTVTFTIDGKTIHTSSVSNSPSTVSFTYSPTSSGTATLKATVIDSVLYSASQTASINSQAVSNLSVTVVSHGGPGQYRVNWAGGNAPYSVSVNNNPYPTCQNINETKCDIAAGPNSQVVVSDSAGGSGSAQTQ